MARYFPPQERECAYPTPAAMEGGGNIGDSHLFQGYSVAGLAASNGMLEEAVVYDTYGEATIYQWSIGDVDQSDFSVFQRCYGGAGIPVDPSCTG